MNVLVVAEMRRRGSLSRGAESPQVLREWRRCTSKPAGSLAILEVAKDRLAPIVCANGTRTVNFYVCVETPLRTL